MRDKLCFLMYRMKRDTLNWCNRRYIKYYIYLHICIYLSLAWIDQMIIELFSWVWRVTALRTLLLVVAIAQSVRCLNSWSSVQYRGKRVMKREQGEAEEEREWEEGRGRVRKREHCFVLLVTLCFWHRLALKTASSIGIVAFFFCPFFSPFFCHFCSTSLVYAIALRVSCTFAASSDAHLKVCNATNENEHKQKRER